MNLAAIDHPETRPRMIKRVGHVMWPHGTYAKLGIALGGASVVSLIVHGFDVGLYGVFDRLYGYYDGLMTLLLGWIPQVIIEIGNQLGIAVSVFDHWRDIFVLSLLYVTRDVTISLSQSASLGGLRWKAFVIIYNAAFGTAICFLTSILVGLYDLHSVSLPQALLVMGIPVAGFFLYMSLDVVGVALFFREKWAVHTSMVDPTFFEFVRFYLTLFTLRTLIPVLLIGFPLVYFQPMDGAGGAVLFFLGFVASQAIYNIMFGFWSAVKHKRDHGDWLEAFRTGYHYKLGTAIIAVFLHTLLFLALNGGLSLVNL